MVPGYTDISHFRAPYKNSAIYTGVGAADASSALAQVTVTDDQGRVLYKPEVQDVIKASLKGYAAVWLSDRAVALEPLTAEQQAAIAQNPDYAKQISAEAWFDKKLSDGNVVFATLGVVFPQPNLNRQLAAVPQDDKSTVAMTSHIAPILAEPTFLSKFGTPLAVGAAVLVGGVVVYAIYAGMKKKGGGRYAAAA